MSFLVLLEATLPPPAVRTPADDGIDPVSGSALWSDAQEQPALPDEAINEPAGNAETENGMTENCATANGRRPLGPVTGPTEARAREIPPAPTDYHHFWETFSSSDAAAGLEPDELHLYRLVVDRIRAHHGKGPHDPIAPELTEDFYSQMHPYLIAQGLESGSQAYMTEKYYLTKVRNTVDLITQGLPAPETIDKALRRAMREQGLTLRKLSKDSGIARNTLRQWVYGFSHPSRAGRAQIEILETRLDLEKGALLRLVCHWPTEDDLRTCLTENGRRSRMYTKEQQYFHHQREWSDELKKELAGLIEHKKGRMRPRMKGRLPSCSGTGFTDRNGYFPSVAIYRKFFEGFFGFLILDRSRGGIAMKPKDLTLGLVTDGDLLDAYFEFVRSRTRTGEHSSQIKVNIGIVMGLLRADTGYLWNRADIFAQHRHFRGRLPTEERLGRGPDRVIALKSPVSQWEVQCETGFTELADFRDQLNHTPGAIQESRLVLEPIKKILEYERPWDLLWLWEHRMLAEPQPHTWPDGTLATRYQDLLFMRMLIRYAFRRSTLAFIRLDDFVECGSRIELVLPPERFKNRTFLRGAIWRMVLDDALAEAFVAFRDRWRPAMRGAEHCPYLFVKQRNNPENTANSFQTRCRILSQCYLSEYTPGIGPQSVRDIGASHIILTTGGSPEGRMQAARLLWDSEETVLRVYAKIISRALQRRDADFIEAQIARQAAIVAELGGTPPRWVEAADAALLKCVRNS